MKTTKFFIATALALLALAGLVGTGSAETQVCSGTWTTIGNPYTFYGVQFTAQTNTVSGATNTLTMSVYNQDGYAKTVVYTKYKCRCWQNEGDPLYPHGGTLGACWYYWSPATPELGCQGTQETIYLDPYETEYIQVSVTQYANQACGSFQLDFAVDSVNGEAVPGTLDERLTGWSFTDLCEDCSQTTTTTTTQSTTSTTCIGKLKILKYNDSDGDGYKDPDENGLPGWEFTVTGPTGVSGTTNATGYIYITGLSAGSYTATEVMQEGWRNTTPMSQTTYVGGCTTRTLKFGNQQASTTTTTTCPSTTSTTKATTTTTTCPSTTTTTRPTTTTTKLTTTTTRPTTTTTKCTTTTTTCPSTTSTTKATTTTTTCPSTTTTTRPTTTTTKCTTSTTRPTTTTTTCPSTTTTTRPTTTTTVPNASEFGGAGIGTVAAMLLIAPAFAYLFTKKR